MRAHSFRAQFLSAGVPADQIDITLGHFFGQGVAPEITSEGEYRAAKALYAVMDASMPPKNFHSPMARYVITLGARVAEWEGRSTPALD